MMFSEIFQLLPAWFRRPPLPPVPLRCYFMHLLHPRVAYIASRSGLPVHMSWTEENGEVVEFVFRGKSEVRLRDHQLWDYFLAGSHSEIDAMVSDAVNLAATKKVTA